MGRAGGTGDGGFRNSGESHYDTDGGNSGGSRYDGDSPEFWRSPIPGPGVVLPAKKLRDETRRTKKRPRSIPRSFSLLNFRPRDYFLRWRILLRMRRFFRPTFRRPLPVFFVPT